MSLFQPKQKIIHELSLIDVLIDANCLSNTTPLFLYIFAGLIEPVFLLYKKSGHPPWIPTSKLYTLHRGNAAYPHSRYAQSCKLVFALAHGVVKYEPIEEKDYWEEEGEFEGVE